jgi:hypothetical protein
MATEPAVPMTEAMKIEDSRVRVYDVWVEADEEMVNLGWVEEPTVETGLDLAPIVNSQLFKQELGDRVLGVKPTLAMKLMECTLANIRRAYPWHTGDGPIALAPTTLGGDLYAYAKAYAFHPRDKSSGAGYGAPDYVHTDDILVYKAVPVGPMTHAADGAKESAIPLKLKAYPDRSQLPSIVIGAIGELMTFDPPTP